MRIQLGCGALVALCLSWTALAQAPSPMREGNWELSTKIMMAGMPVEAPPMKQTMCVTAEMLRNPAEAMSKIPGSDCKVTDYKLQGSTATYKMMCTQPAPISAVGEMKYAGSDAYTGTVTIDMGGQNMTLSTDAKRIGDCAK